MTDVVSFTVIDGAGRRQVSVSVTPQMRTERPGYCALLEMCHGGEVYTSGAKRYPENRYRAAVIGTTKGERDGRQG